MVGRPLRPASAPRARENLSCKKCSGETSTDGADASKKKRRLREAPLPDRCERPSVRYEPLFERELFSEPEEASDVPPVLDEEPVPEDPDIDEPELPLPEEP